MSDSTYDDSYRPQVPSFKSYHMMLTWICTVILYWTFHRRKSRKTSCFDIFITNHKLFSLNLIKVKLHPSTVHFHSCFFLCGLLFCHTLLNFRSSQWQSVRLSYSVCHPVLFVCPPFLIPCLNRTHIPIVCLHSAYCCQGHWPKH